MTREVSYRLFTAFSGQVGIELLDPCALAPQATFTAHQCRALAFLFEQAAAQIDSPDSRDAVELRQFGVARHHTITLPGADW